MASKWDWVTHSIIRPLCGVACHSAPVFKAKPPGSSLGAAKDVFSFLPHSQAAWTRHLPVQAPNAGPITRCLSRQPLGRMADAPFLRWDPAPCTQARSPSSQGRRGHRHVLIGVVVQSVQFGANPNGVQILIWEQTPESECLHFVFCKMGIAVVPAAQNEIQETCL